MNKTVVRVGALAIFICIIAVAVWVIIYFGQRIVHPVYEEPVAFEVLDATSTELDWASLATSTGVEPRVEVSVHLETFFANPFSFSATNTFPEDMAWRLVDSSDTLLASGMIPGMLSSYSARFDRYWYRAVPSSRFGLLIVERGAGEAPLEFPVQLETKTQTVEVYFRNPAMSNCNAVEPIKRTIVSTGDDELNFYEAAMRELLAGPSDNASENLFITMIPTSTKLLSVGKEENGRFFADFDPSLYDDIAIDCFRLIAQAQIEETLSTVPFPGRRLTGILMINGKEVDWEL